MPSHRYWGLLLYCRSVSGTLNVSLAELDFRATVGGADMCTGGTGSAASSDGSDTPDKAFDNNNATYWSRSGNSTIRLWYDFGSAVSVAEAWFRLPGAGAAKPGATHGPLGVQIVGSNDATNWVPYKTYELTSIANDAEYTVALGSLATSQVQGTAWRLAPGRPGGAPGARRPSIVGRYDAVDGGTHRVAGTVAIDGTPAVPVRRRVRLFHERTGRLVREVWSNLDGTFEFANLALAEYIVLTDDHTRLYNAVVADKVTAVV